MDLDAVAIIGQIEEIIEPKEGVTVSLNSKIDNPLAYTKTGDHTKTGTNLTGGGALLSTARAR